MTKLDYEPKGVTERRARMLPGFLTASGVICAVTIALMLIGLWDDARGGPAMQWIGLLPLALGALAVILGLAAVLKGPLRLLALFVTVFAGIVTWRVGQILAGYWGA